MGSYSVRLKPSAEKDLRKLPRDVLQRIFQVLEGLTSDPFPHQASKLTGTDRLYRIRVGDYRIVYEADAAEITVHYIRHRRDVYRQI
jgi:mRNA interferase RelE/StbE